MLGLQNSPIQPLASLVRDPQTTDGRKGFCMSENLDQLLPIGVVSIELEG